MIRTIAITAFLFAGVVARSAHAQPSPNGAAAAVTLFDEGRALMVQGRHAEACDRFARSDRLDPGVGTRLSLGECNERLRKTASAWAAYKDAEALAMQRGDARAAVAQKRAEKLEPELARLTIRVDASVADAVVKRNGARVDPAALDTAVPVDAGPQSIEVTAPGRRPWRTTLGIADREAKEVRVPPLEPEPTAAAPAPIPADEDAGDGQRTLALGLEIGGGVALAGGLVFGGLALSKWSSIEDTCPDGRCPTEAERLRLAPEVGTARTLATVSTVTIGLGVAALAAGIVLHVTAPSRRIAVAPLVDRGCAGLGGAFVF
jgi:hypothetical protein